MRKRRPHRWQLVAVRNGAQELDRLEPPLSIEVLPIHVTYIEGSPAGEERVVYRLFEARVQGLDVVAAGVTEEQAVARLVGRLAAGHPRRADQSADQETQAARRPVCGQDYCTGQPHSQMWDDPSIEGAAAQ